MTVEVVDFNRETARLIFFNFYPSMVQQLQINSKIRVSGVASQQHHHQVTFIHPQWKIIKNKEPLEGIAAVYRKIPGITTNNIRKFIAQIIKEQPINQLIPSYYVNKYNLLTIREAFICLHGLTNCPVTEKPRFCALRSLAFEEMLTYVMLSKKAKYQYNTMSAQALKNNQLDKFIAALPFSLTFAQNRVIDSLKADLERTVPMARLVQGDVGSGKTVVAAAALFIASMSNTQSVFMAPTEILAQQHYLTLSSLFKLFNIPVVFLVGKCTIRQRNKIKDTIDKHDNAVIVGTHAVFQDAVHYKKLSLVVIDEQHRFGVEQRLSLLEKSSLNTYPHQLIMSATPIPRTLAMTFYGDLELSVIDEMPPNRQLIQTTIINADKQITLIDRIYKHTRLGEQIYWVCPFIEPSKKEEFKHVQNVTTLFNTIKGVYPDLRLGLIHGKLSTNEKSQVMNNFKQHQIDLLIATTVIEVGVDVPNASIMIIDNAERMGLSQLHQLRGRVGRGIKQSYCILLYHGDLTKTAHKRLELMRSTQDGFILSEEDLHLRGPGDIMGKNQTGDIAFKVADLNTINIDMQDIGDIAEKMLLSHPHLLNILQCRWLDNKNYNKA